MSKGRDVAKTPIIEASVILDPMFVMYLVMLRDLDGWEICRSRHIGAFRIFLAMTRVPPNLLEGATATAMALGHACETCADRDKCPFGQKSITDLLPVPSSSF